MAVCTLSVCLPTHRSCKIRKCTTSKWIWPQWRCLCSQRRHIRTDTMMQCLSKSMVRAVMMSSVLDPTSRLPEDRFNDSWKTAAYAVHFFNLIVTLYFHLKVCGCRLLQHTNGVAHRLTSSTQLSSSMPP